MSEKTGSFQATTKRRTFQGFDYQHATAVELPKREWLKRFDNVFKAGGVKKRIAGDLTAFDANGRMLFEMYENAELEAQS